MHNNGTFDRLFRIRKNTSGRLLNGFWQLEKLSTLTYDGSPYYKLITHYPTWREAYDRAENDASLYRELGLTAPTQTQKITVHTTAS